MISVKPTHQTGTFSKNILIWNTDLFVSNKVIVPKFFVIKVGRDIL